MTATTLAHANRRTLIGTGAIAAGMVALSFAAVPLYKLFCATTGYGGTTQRVEAAALPDQRRLTGATIKVRFDGNTSPGVPWQFRPETNEVIVRLGERKMAFYKATNFSAAETTGTATFNVTPDLAGKYFKKIQCFCFNEQTLKAGETVEMPVTYYVDPAILNDPQARKIDEITLSYTFFPVDASKRSQLQTDESNKG